MIPTYNRLNNMKNDLILENRRTIVVRSFLNHYFTFLSTF